MPTRRTCLSALAGLYARLLVAKGSPSYRESIERWRQEQEEGVLGPEGAFTVVSLWFPKEGISRIGSDKSCDLRAEDQTFPDTSVT